MNKKTKWDVTDDVLVRIKQLAGHGIEADDMYAHLTVSPETFEVHYERDERIAQAIWAGKASTTRLATRKLLERIEAGDMRAVTFWLRYKAGWIDCVEISGKLETTIAIPKSMPANAIEAQKIYKEVMK